MKSQKLSTNKPIVFWHSDPVMPDETLVLSGADFSADSVVELALVGDNSKTKWTAVAPEQWSEISLKAVVPATWPKGVYACRVRNGENVSKTVFLNEPDVWWKQGEGGGDAALSGGWLRLFGKCLDIDGGAKVRLANGPELELEERGCFALRAKVPDGLPAGDYQVESSNGQGGAAGWRTSGTLVVKAPVPDTRPVFNVLENGADPTGMKDCTLAIVQALERAHGMKTGGIVYLPRGRYRVDGTLRSGTFMDSPLVLPENVSLRGEGASLTSLWWPTRENPLPMLIECRRGCSVEDLAIYSQGPRQVTITGDSDVTLKNLLIRANAYYMTYGPGTTHHGNRSPDNGGGPAISLWGGNNRVLNCDILVSSNVLDIRSGRGNVISGNTLRGSGTHALNFCSEMIYENNVFEGSCLSGGGNIALHFGGVISRHIYYANNRTRHLYTGDHECLTFDGHGGGYFGRVENVEGDCFMLADRFQRLEGKGAMRDMHGTAVYVIDGRGAGQYRFLSSYDADGHIVIDRPWDVEPDAISLIWIGGFNGRHIILGNTGEDVGTLVQLYPANCECLVVGNKGIRASNINSISASGSADINETEKITRMEVSWRNQFLDNEIIFGNAWGGGQTEVGRWLGGETSLLIHGPARRWIHRTDDVLHGYQSPEWVAAALGEDKLRDINIPPSRFQIVRRHIIRNNSSIRIRGCVADAVIEHCQIAHSRQGVRIDMEVQTDRPNDLGQVCDFCPEPSAEHPALTFLRPTGVLARRNHFENVEVPYSGSALGEAKVELDMKKGANHNLLNVCFHAECESRGLQRSRGSTSLGATVSK